MDYKYRIRVLRASLSPMSLWLSTLELKIKGVWLTSGLNILGF